MDRLNRIWTGYYTSGAIKKKGDHLIWCKCINDSGYGRINLTLNQKSGDTVRKQIYAHTFSYKLANPTYDTDGKALTISHLCGIKTCVDSNHLVAEPLKINISRKRCQSQKNCTGHPRVNENDEPIENHPLCILK